jgi:hypothetical protein
MKESRTLKTRSLGPLKVSEKRAVIPIIGDRYQPAMTELVNG